VNPHKKPELLAPAGGIECFHAAIEAGADAVYLGLVDFNARLRAKNFTVKTLSFLVPYAHANKRKVYVTLNTLIKQSEVEKLVHILYQLDQVRVDGLIVQDLGLIELCRTAFPRLRLHASTQMAIHNVSGLAAARELGLRRAVVARELTLKEITALRRESSVELELFVHGALCYCISGMCLASSFLGGSSGNRGRCTQVCRRPFIAREEQGCFFSPHDMCAMSFLERFRDIGIDSFKIEGRMKSADYVSTVVTAYRKAIDDPSSLPGLLETIDEDLARNKTSFFLGGLRTNGIIEPAGPTGTGLFLGTIVSRNGAEITVSGAGVVKEGDVVRLQPSSGFEGKNVRVAGVRAENNRYTIILRDNIDGAIGDAVYLTRRAAPLGEQQSRRAIPLRPTPFKQIYPKARGLLQRYGPNSKVPKTGIQRRLFVKIDDPRWLPLLNISAADAFIAAFDMKETEELLLKGSISDAWVKKMIVGLPHFIPQSQLSNWERIARGLTRKGFFRVMCQNLGQWKLFDASVKAYGDAWLWCFNRAAQETLKNAGLSHFSFSIEDDYPNIRSTSSPAAMTYVYARVPLFISRIEPAGAAGAEGARHAEPLLTDAHGNEFYTARKHGLYYLIAKKPFCIFHKIAKLEEAGITTFIMDLSFCDPDKRLFQSLMEYYQHGMKLPESSMFNFKEGIR
jgi:putative protease